MATVVVDAGATREDLFQMLMESRAQAAKREMDLFAQIRELQTENVEIASKLMHRLELELETRNVMQARLNDQAQEASSQVTQVTDEFRRKEQVLESQLRELIQHLHAVDEVRSRQEGEREGKLKESVSTIARLEASIKEASARLGEAEQIRTSLFRQLELCREKQRLLEERNRSLEDEVAQRKTIVSLLATIDRLASSQGRTGLDESEIADQIQVIGQSDLFDAAWYTGKYGDEMNSEESPAQHYVRCGWLKGYAPSRNFDPAAYVAQYPDVAESNTNPLYHFLKYGRQEGRSYRSIDGSGL